MKRHAWGMAGIAAIGAIVGIFALLGSSQAAQSETDCTTELTPDDSIQSAIDEAEAGAVICLGEGTWTEHVTIEKSLTLRGAGAESSIIEASEEDRSVVVVNSPEKIDVAIESLTVTGAAGENAGIRVEGAVQATLQNSTVSKNDSEGIRLEDSAQATITGSTVSENSIGITLVNSVQATIQSSTVSENEFFGLTVLGSAQTTITDSTVTEHERDGVILAGSARATIQDSTVAMNGPDFSSVSGIELSDSAQATIRGNEITNNGEYGVVLREAPCFDTADETFTGVVEGGMNTFDGNAEGPVCPDALQFLTTEEGGELDRTE